MILRSRYLLSLLTFLAVLQISSAASATSFCKCTCFSNSTIIPLNPPASKASSSHRSLARDTDSLFVQERDEKPSRERNCNDCNRRFCLDYDLPICKGAREEDVFSVCFQRDSTKDEAVVFIFIFATTGLLIWAGIKPWVEKGMQSARERRSYIPVSGQGDS